MVSKVTPLSPYLKSKEWHVNRQSGIGASDATILAKGNHDAIYDLWLLKTGRKVPGLEITQPILFGMVTEEANRRWFSSRTNRNVWGYAEERTHPDYPYIRASLDGITTSDDGREAYLECKCVNAFAKLPAQIEKYIYQCHHAMACGNWDVSILSIFFGTLKYEFVEIEFDPWFWLDLLDLEEEFWACVQENREPDTNVIRGIVP